MLMSGADGQEGLPISTFDVSLVRDDELPKASAALTEENDKNNSARREVMDIVSYLLK